MSAVSDCVRRRACMHAHVCLAIFQECLQFRMLKDLVAVNRVLLGHHDMGQSGVARLRNSLVYAANLDCNVQRQ